MHVILFLRGPLARGKAVRTYFEISDPASFFHFLKLGASGQASLLMVREFDWIIRPRFEMGSEMPRYQLFELGGGSLRSFPTQEFRGASYFSIQNDLLITSADIWKFKVRPLVYVDWAWVQNSGHTGIGTGFQLYLHDIAVPALQFFLGYGFNPDGFGTTVTIGPQF
ncbi:hypothetical protein WDW37_15490 [Bdellovibrionota bacterium FG-1]